MILFICLILIISMYLFVGEGWKPWDYAAGSLMVTEAGGVMASVDGSTFSLYGSGVVSTSTLALRDDVLQILHSCQNGK